MRQFSDLSTLIESIRRDLVKSPIIDSHRVQAVGVKAKVHEAVNYSYSIPAKAFEGLDFYKYCLLWGKYLPQFEDDIVSYVSWESLEDLHRFQPLSKSSRYSRASEELHPGLKGHHEGEHFGYTYRERMIGMLPAMEAVLTKDLYSRRAYWPIFQPIDSHRASDLTRIPCTLGYHFMIRDIEMIGPQLHVTNHQRSCDFNSFFPTDLWFSMLAQKKLAERLDVARGLITHNIISFHSFINAEIY